MCDVVFDGSHVGSFHRHDFYTVVYIISPKLKHTNHRKPFSFLHLKKKNIT